MFDIAGPEKWRDIEGYEGLYQVSNLGRVKSVKRNKVITSSVPPNGYHLVQLWKSGKCVCKSIHRLVAEHFIPNPNNLPQVNHKDENKSNNVEFNLEWCDEAYNINYGTGVDRRSKTKSKPVYQYKLTGELVKEWACAAETRKFGFNPAHVGCCCKGVMRQHKGYVWKYKEVN